MTHRIARQSRSRKRSSLTVLDVFLLVILTLGAAMIVIPFWNVLVVSFATPKEYADRPFMLFLQNPTLESYRFLFKGGQILQGYLNTGKLLLMGLPLSMFLTVTMAYGLSRKAFPGRKFFIVAVLFTMIFNGGIVPLYLVVKEYGLRGSMWAVTLTTCFNTFNVILMMNYFSSLPESLVESARLDGAGEWRILLRIVLPLSAPILATITLFYGVQIWNEWYHSMIFLRKASQLPLQNVLRSIIQEAVIDPRASSLDALQQRAQFSDGIKMAAVFLTMTPIMCFFPLLQKHFAKGVMVGAIK